jgi:hypothetical protein
MPARAEFSQALPYRARAPDPAYPGRRQRLLAPHGTASPSIVHDLGRSLAIALCQIVPWAAVEPHSVVVLPRNDPDAIVLDFVKPDRAGRRFRC